MSDRQVRSDARGARRREPVWRDERDEDDDSDDLDGRGGGRGVSPGLIFLAIAVIGSIAYMGYVITVRDSSQIPLMASGAVVLAIVFLALAGWSLRATWRAGAEGRGGRALGFALVGGGAAIAAAGFVAGAIILFQLASGPG